MAKLTKKQRVMLQGILEVAEKAQTLLAADLTRRGESNLDDATDRLAAFIVDNS